MTLRLAVVLAAGLISSLPAAPATDDDGLKVTPIVSDGTVAVSIAGGGALGPDVRTLIESGLLVTLTFDINLRKPVPFWWDSTVRSQSVSSTIKLDMLSGTYHVSRLQQSHVTWSDRTRTFAEARDWSATFDRVPLAVQRELDANTDYYIDVHLSTSPKRTFSLWPFGGGRSSRANFTFIR